MSHLLKFRNIYQSEETKSGEKVEEESYKTRIIIAWEYHEKNIITRKTYNKLNVDSRA